MKLNINRYINQLKPSATLAVNQKVAELRQKGKTIYHFGFGQSPFPVHPSIVNALKAHASDNRYLPSTGLPELKTRIAGYLKSHHGIDRSSSYTYIGPGSKELLYQTIMILEGVFLIPRGSWVSYVPQISSKGGSYHIIPTTIETNYKLTATHLEAVCKSHREVQKTLIINSPNNPTGAVYDEEELKALATVCRKYDLIVLSDEIYGLINFSAQRSPSMAAFYPEKTIVYAGMSKIFSAGGYRLGFMALPDSLHYLHNTYQSFFSETFSAVAAPVQYAALEAYAMKMPVVTQIRQNSAILSAVGAYVYEELTSVGVVCTMPQGAFYILVDLSQFGESLQKLELFTSLDIAKYLLSEIGVALLPGSDFYFDPETPIFRLAYVDFLGADWYEAGIDTAHINNEQIQRYAPHVYKGISKMKEFLVNLGS